METQLEAELQALRTQIKTKKDEIDELKELKQNVDERLLKLNVLESRELELIKKIFSYCYGRL